LAKISNRNAAKVCEELAEERLVQAKPVSHESVVSRVTILTCNGNNGIAGRQVHQQEAHENNADCRWNNKEQPPNDKGIFHYLQTAVAAKWGEIPKP